MRTYPLSATSGQGAVVAPHALAAMAGREVLRGGGNAIEAMLAAGAMIAVTYPHMNSLGGDNFWLIYDARRKAYLGINGSGRAGTQATIEAYQRRGYARIPFRGYLSAITVPGAVSGWDLAFRYSQEQLRGIYSWTSLLSPAIEAASKGFPVSRGQAVWTRKSLDAQVPKDQDLHHFPGFCRAFLKPGGMPYEEGELFCQPDLAKSLGVLVDEGASAFYTGTLAKMILRELRENGGLLGEEDFRRHRAEWMMPISVPYRGFTAYNLPPHTQGMASLSLLNILQNFQMDGIPEGSADYVHLLVEATKLAFRDRDRWLSDPSFVPIPLAQLLSIAHGRTLAKKISMAHAADFPAQPIGGDTVWLGAVDAEGNAVSMIQSIYHDFGSGIVIDGTGITLQNRGSFFSLDTRSPNALRPGKHTFHTLNPAMLDKGGKPYLVYGTMGGEGQPQTQAALVTRIVDYGLPVAQAIDAPRWLYGRAWGEASSGLQVESRIPRETQEELSRRGHAVSVVDNYSDRMGQAGAILVRPGIIEASADPRSDGMAAAI